MNRDIYAKCIQLMSLFNHGWQVIYEYTGLKSLDSSIIIRLTSDIKKHNRSLGSKLLLLSYHRSTFFQEVDA